jgi:signal transduction histidine kinase
MPGLSQRSQMPLTGKPPYPLPSGMQDTGGELTVASKRSEDGQILISVTDSGIGLSFDEAERIFEAFFTTKPQGTGMGLSISLRIIASHGGRLWASPNTGRGATFQFTLPPT